PGEAHVAGQRIDGDRRQELAPGGRVVVHLHWRAPGLTKVVRVFEVNVGVVRLVGGFIGPHRVEPAAGGVVAVVEGDVHLRVDRPVRLRRDKVKSADVGRGEELVGAEAVAGAGGVGGDVEVVGALAGIGGLPRDGELAIGADGHGGVGAKGVV